MIYGCVVVATDGVRAGVLEVSGVVSWDIGINSVQQILASAMPAFPKFYTIF